MKGDVFVHCETTEGALDERAFGLISEGRRLASTLGVDLHAVTVGYTDMPALRALGHRSVRKVYKATISEDQPSCEVEAATLEAIVSKHKPSLILFAATPTSAEVSARLAARLGRGLVSGCVDVRVTESGDRVAVKPLHGGTAHAIVTWTTPPPFLASFQPEVLEVEEATGRTDAVVEEFRLDPPRSRVKVEGYFRVEADKLDLSEADIVFGVGRGLGSIENMQTVKEAASLIH
ncbi:MAG: electron transfer flavoprotein subunit alpha/FixB family protein, partial [Candidatus Bathyarchaeia archaeon]